ncbi:MAG: dihydroorotase family protein [Methanobrevibacter sp.]|uniref:dihydroorotase n=1 Tax=Methanobrevibacter sp. TaxID=66852 RepID=UPI0026E07816|nr:dihydroorotase family protein [Methanobrevibacter sp.]MDO5848163.1 dihydroorotase family protein [Methanobrevibacter sp.]
MDLIIKNAKLINHPWESNIGIENGKIAEISKQPLNGEEKIDLKGNILLPGFIDPHVHFRDPGLTKKEDFRTGSESAANGGFATVIDMPNTLPKTNTYKDFKDKLAIAEKKSIVNFKLQAGVNTYEEMEKIVGLEPASFKIFMDLETDEELEKIFHDLGELRVRSDYNGLVAVHAENQAIVRAESEKLKDSTNPIDYSYGRPDVAEDVSVKQAIDLAYRNNLRLHICHLSTIKSLDLATTAKNFVDISTEFTPHHLLLNNDSYNTYGTIVKTNPPLRENEKSIQIANLDENSIIGTDHAPHTLEEKNQGTWNSSPGIPNLETVVPLLLNEVNKGNIKLELIPKILSENAAKVFGLENKGEIAIGKDADFTAIDLNREGTINIEKFKTKAEYSPFDGFKYKGEPILTIVNGKTVMNKI